MSMILVHLAHLRMKRKHKNSASLRQGVSAHYTLITNNNQLQIEWYVRSILLFSWMKGRTVQLTIQDQSSTDQTLDIIRKLTRHRPTTVDIITADHDPDPGACISSTAPHPPPHPFHHPNQHPNHHPNHHPNQQPNQHPNHHPNHHPNQQPKSVQPPSHQHSRQPYSHHYAHQQSPHHQHPPQSVYYEPHVIVIDLTRSQDLIIPCGL